MTYSPCCFKSQGMIAQLKFKTISEILWKWFEPRSHIISRWMMIVRVSVVLKEGLFEMTLTDISWLWWWLPLRLSNSQSMSPQTVLLRTTLTWTITIYRLMVRFSVNLCQLVYTVSFLFILFSSNRHLKSNLVFEEGKGGTTAPKSTMGLSLKCKDNYN